MCWDDPTDAPQCYFVWVRGLRGPAPQKWAELDFGVGDWKKRYVIAHYALTQDDAKRTLDELARLYPAPALKN